MKEIIENIEKTISAMKVRSIPSNLEPQIASHISADEWVFYKLIKKPFVDDVEKTAIRCKSHPSKLAKNLYLKVRGKI